MSREIVGKHSHGVRFKRCRISHGFLVKKLWRGFVSMKGHYFISHDLENASACKLKIINESKYVMLCCWVDEYGKLFHYTPIQNNQESILDKNVNNVHIENTYQGHSFVCIRENSPEDHQTSLPIHIWDVKRSVSRKEIAF